MLLDDDVDRLRETRLREPGSARGALEGRVRRDFLPPDGRLLIVAADHPARGALRAGEDPMAMADRGELLDRLVAALAHPSVDGVVATADILEDLAVLGALEGKLAIGSVNRGGLADSVFELDDRVTGYGVDGAVGSHLDGIKCLLRIDRADPGTVATLERTAQIVDAAASGRLPVFLEPFLSTRRDGQVTNDLSADAVINSITIAQAIGSTSAWTWLKVPVVPDMERVVRSSTLPIVLLGGETAADPEPRYEEWRRALALPGVRGMMIGRSVLYPHDGEVSAAIDRVASLVHPV